MRSVLLIFLVFLTSVFGFAQIVFSEEFNEVDLTTGGSDAIGPTDWNTSCFSCVDAGDYFYVLGNELVAQDVNATGATWTTDLFDISSCVGLTISMDIDQVGTMEGCGDCGIGDGTACVDWIKLEYSFDGVTWIEVVGTTCALLLAPGELIQIGDIAGARPWAYESPCVDYGLELAIRITALNWEGGENWIFDNIIVECNDCVLPIEIESFDIKKLNDEIHLNWETSSERNNDYFEIERSYNHNNFEVVGKVDGAGNSTLNQQYQFIDSDFHGINAMAYYRLKQIDFDGAHTYSETISQHLGNHKVYYLPTELHLDGLGNDITNEFVYTIYNLTGKIVHQGISSANETIDWQMKGYFIIEIPELGLREKFVAY